MVDEPGFSLAFALTTNGTSVRTLRPDFLVPTLLPEFVATLAVVTAFGVWKKGNTMSIKSLQRRNLETENFASF